jgi:type IV pilus assembly protein PilV
MKSALTLKKQMQNGGFSLLEVLITILIMSFGLLGMAALIISGVRSNNIAHYRSVASKQTEDIADRMRANLAGVTAGNYDSLAESMPASDDCLAGACSPAQMATYDHAQWNRANSILLPGGRGTVGGSLAAGYTITLMWTEKDMDGERDLGCPASVSVNTRCFVSRFAP